jgi:hypothetical protein
MSALRVADFVMAGLGFVGVACCLGALHLSTTPAGGLTLSVMAVVNLGVGACNLRDGIQKRGCE